MNRFAADHVAISHPQRVHFCILAGKTEATTVSLTSNKLSIDFFFAWDMTKKQQQQ